MSRSSRWTSATFEEAGTKVTTTNTLEDAMILADGDGLSGAVIDHALVDGESTKLRAKLVERIPAFMSSSQHRPRRWLARCWVCLTVVKFK
jgi:hypothetical protein